MKNKYLYQGLLIGSEVNEDFSYYRGNVVEELSTGKTFLIDLAKAGDNTLWKDIAVEVYPKSITPLLVEEQPLKLEKGFYVLGNTLIISSSKERLQELDVTLRKSIKTLESLTDMKIIVVPEEI